MIKLVIVTPAKNFGRTEKPDYRAKRMVVSNDTGEKVVWGVELRDAEDLVRFVKENDTEGRLQFTGDVDYEGREVVVAVFPNKTTPTLPPAPPATK